MLELHQSSYCETLNKANIPRGTESNMHQSKSRALSLHYESVLFQTYFWGDNKCPYCLSQNELSVSFPDHQGHLTSDIT